MDNDDRPHIGYYDDIAGRLKYASLTGSRWLIEIVDQSAWLGEFNSIAVDRNDVPHISYLDYSNSKLKYARRAGSAWQTEIVDTANWFGGFTSIALDNVNNPHISYASSASGARYAARARRSAGTSAQSHRMSGIRRWPSTRCRRRTCCSMTGIRVTYGMPGWLERRGRLESVDGVAQVGRYSRSGPG